MNDVTFGSHSNTNFTFPFSIEYTSTMPSNVISDVLSKCGIVGGVTSDITVNYDITASQALDACENFAGSDHFLLC